MSDSASHWFLVVWSGAAACLIVSVILRFRLVHALSARYPALYLSLGSPAFFFSWSPMGRRDLISALSDMPRGTLARPEILLVRSLRLVYVLGMMGALMGVAIVGFEALQ